MRRPHRGCATTRPPADFSNPFGVTNPFGVNNGMDGMDRKRLRFERRRCKLLSPCPPPTYLPSSCQETHLVKHRMLVAVLTLSAGTAAFAVDWPQFRGPKRDDVSTEKGLMQTWPDDGPPLVWTAKGLGGGYSSLSVAGDRVYTLGNQGNATKVVALERDTRKVPWASELGASGRNLGCTPTVDRNHVYAICQAGDIVCLETAKGTRVWHHNFVKEFGGKFGGWRYCESPLVDGDRVICTPGGADATMIALNKLTGEVVWKCAIPVKHTEAGYSSVDQRQIGRAHV